MKIGVYAGGVARDNGGMFQSAVNIIHLLHEATPGSEDEYIVLLDGDAAVSFDLPNWKSVKLPGAKADRHTPLDYLRRMVGEGCHRKLWRKFRYKFFSPINTDVNTRAINKELTAFCRGLELDFIFYPCFARLEIDIPYIAFVADLQHQLQPGFPEVSKNGEWYSRERYFRNLIKHATILIVDSETGKDDVLYYYSELGVSEEQIFVLPYTAYCRLNQNLSLGDAERILEKHRLPERFLFYPAQFWAHKNHIRIIKALALIKSRFREEINIVFTGSASGKMREENYDELLKFCRENELDGQVKLLGYVTDDELSALYRRCVALVMPTFFGPANIPIIEAWSMGCPVIYSDIRGLREQAGNAALLVDPNSVPDIADKIRDIWQNQNLRSELIQNGKTRVANFNKEEYKGILLNIILHAKGNVK